MATALTITAPSVARETVRQLTRSCRPGLLPRLTRPSSSITPATLPVPDTGPLSVGTTSMLEICFGVGGSMCLGALPPTASFQSLVRWRGNAGKQRAVPVARPRDICEGVWLQKEADEPLWEVGYLTTAQECELPLPAHRNHVVVSDQGTCSSINAQLSVTLRLGRVRVKQSPQLGDWLETTSGPVGGELNIKPTLSQASVPRPAAIGPHGKRRIMAREVEPPSAVTACLNATSPSNSFEFALTLEGNEAVSFAVHAEGNVWNGTLAHSCRSTRVSLTNLEGNSDLFLETTESLLNSRRRTFPLPAQREPLHCWPLLLHVAHPGVWKLQLAEVAATEVEVGLPDEWSAFVTHVPTATGLELAFASPPPADGLVTLTHAATGRRGCVPVLRTVSG